MYKSGKSFYIRERVKTMYSDSPHIIDVFNDSEEIKASFKEEKNLTDNWTEGYIILKCKIKRDKIVAPDSTGSIYAHVTDGVQHMRLVITPEEVEKQPKGKK